MLRSLCRNNRGLMTLFPPILQNQFALRPWLAAPYAERISPVVCLKRVQQAFFADRTVSADTFRPRHKRVPAYGVAAARKKHFGFRTQTFRLGSPFLFADAGRQKLWDRSVMFSAVHPTPSPGEINLTQQMPVFFGSGFVQPVDIRDFCFAVSSVCLLQTHVAECRSAAFSRQPSRGKQNAIGGGGLAACDDSAFLVGAVSQVLLCYLLAGPAPFPSGVFNDVRRVARE